MFHSAHAKNTTWQSALQDCLDELDEDLDATIGFVYVTDSIAPHLSSILETLKLKTGIDSWVGSASPGICSIGLSDAQEYFGVAAIAVMTADLPRTEFEVFQTIDTITSEDRVKPRENKQFISETPLILLHADYANEDVLEIMDDISIRTEGYLIGGLTLSDTPKHHIAGEVTGGGVSGVIFNSSIGVVTSLSQGCRPIGKIHEVTECSENFIIGLDGRSAIDVFQEDIGDILSRDLQKVGGFIHAALPVTGSDTGDYVVRNLIGVDTNEGVIAIAAPVEHGDGIMFVSRDANAAQKDLADMVVGLKKRAGQNIKGGIYISCIARGPHMFGEANAEVQIIKSILGDIPIIGLYANGEISNNQLYSYTGVLTLFI